MLRRVLIKTTKNKKLKKLIKKYKIPPEYLSANRKMASRAVLIGIFIAFIPMPMQMLAVLSVVPFIKFNVLIAIAMVWLSNPFTMPAMYYMEYLTGSFILGTQIEPIQMSLEWFSANLSNIFIPLYTGTLFYSFTVSIIAYYLVNYLWYLSAKRDRKLHPKNRKRD